MLLNIFLFPKATLYFDFIIPVPAFLLVSSLSGYTYKKKAHFQVMSIRLFEVYSKFPYKRLLVNFYLGDLSNWERCFENNRGTLDFFL
jgi:hypothetical protein